MADKRKYKDSLNLPQTEFPMRGDLARREPELLARWRQMGIYERALAARADAPAFVLHDGPPYSNGHLHYGHVLNKVLKDVIVKYRTMAGFRAPYVPGWDTHGLPIELAVDRELGERKREMSVADIRAACRDYALRFVDIQRQEFERLGVFGAWDEPYLTLNRGYEAAIVRALAAFTRGGYLYRGKKPVYWCPADRTALAEAEIEYRPHTSPSIYVRFPLHASFDPAALDERLAGRRVSLAIWTTTPWTLPANLAIVAHRQLRYVAVRSPRDDGEYLLCARELAPAFLAAIGSPLAAAAAGAAAAGGDPGSADWSVHGVGDGIIDVRPERLGALEGARYVHPLADAVAASGSGDAPAASERADAAFRVWFADYVTVEQGTGLVHTAPGHGADDYATGVAHGLEPFSPIDDAGRFTDEVPRWAGKTTAEANPEIVAALHEAGYLLNAPGESIEHQYAHCWRCKGPTLFRATPQWFLRIDHNALRRRALDETNLTQWLPAWGKQRIHGMIESRPDWCLSRQRVWGVPIPAFYCGECGAVHADARLMEHVADLFAAEGSDIWYTWPVKDLVPNSFACSCGALGYSLERERDIVDVWFESGCSWLAVALTRPDHDRIDLYVEGSDQHRGWFHSSLLVGIGVRGDAPYKTVITHGWVLDEDGHPYSKSEIEKARAAGKKVKYAPPAEVIEERGAELLRLWVAAADYRGDVAYSEAILAGLTDWYRKLRNTCRFMLGNLHDFSPDDNPLERAALTELDRYMLARLGDLAARVRDAYDAYELHAVHRALVEFVTVDLSALYLDVVKDRLYTEAHDAPGRRAAQCVLYAVVRALALLAAPITCFTSEEIWRHLPRRAEDPDSVHLALMPAGKPLAPDDPIATVWAVLLEYRDLVNKALESFRADKNRSLDARVTITPTARTRPALADRLDALAELFIVSDVRLADTDASEPSARVEAHPGTRCERCWRWYDHMSASTPELCARCDDAVAASARRAGG